MFWRRRRARDVPPPPDEPLEWQPRLVPSTFPRWGEVGIHGIHRPRRWDAIAVAEAPGITGDDAAFVTLPDGSIVAEGDAEGDLSPLARALEAELAPPYRAHGERQRRDLWAVAGVAIEVVEVKERLLADDVSLAVRGGERTLTIGGMPSLDALPTLEELGASRFGDFVVQAQRLEGDLWEVQVAAL